VRARWEGAVDMGRAGLAAPIAALLVVSLVACGPGPTQQPIVSSAQPSVTGTASRTPTAPPVAVDSPTPAADPCPRQPDNGRATIDPLLPGSAVKVAVATLDLRAGPCLAALKLGTLDAGTVLIATDNLDGPVKADGMSWYAVVFPPNLLPSGVLPKLPEQWFPDGTDTDGGWIAAADASTAYVTPLAARCPTRVDLENVSAMLPAERLACFNKPIVLEGTFGCGGCGGTGGPTSKPTWLADTFEFVQMRVRWGAEPEFRPVGIHFPPAGLAAPKEGSIIRATVHVDDPAAATCTFTWAIDGPTFPVPTTTATNWCRERLVVDSYMVIGVDPNYLG
jgi:hypothetical protein